MCSIERALRSFGKLLQLIAIMGICGLMFFFYAPSVLSERGDRTLQQRFSLDFGQCTKIGSISVMIILGRSIKASWLLQDFRRV